MLASLPGWEGSSSGQIEKSGSSLKKSLTGSRALRGAAAVLLLLSCVQPARAGGAGGSRPAEPLSFAGIELAPLAGWLGSIGAALPLPAEAELPFDVTELMVRVPSPEASPAWIAGDESRELGELLDEVLTQQEEQLESGAVDDRPDDLELDLLEPGPE
jgi:hypothetical protein